MILGGRVSGIHHLNPNSKGVPFLREGGPLYLGNFGEKSSTEKCPGRYAFYGKISPPKKKYDLQTSKTYKFSFFRLQVF